MIMYLSLDGKGWKDKEMKDLREKCNLLEAETKDLKAVLAELLLAGLLKK